MASFSYQQHHPFILDQSFFFPTTAAAATAATASATTGFPHDHPYSFNGHHISNCPSIININNNDQLSLQTKLLQSPDSSISVVLDDHKVESATMQLPKKRKDKIVYSLNSAQSKDTRKEMNNRLKKQKKSNNDDQEEKKKKYVKKCSEEEGQNGYIHVRARRGQATDSHSLAERVRREKISERMKLLQSIVPGCDKVTGKALMLDEIINYVQSLQNQVEFLSLKLASVNPMFYDFGVDLDTFVLKPDQSMSSMELPIMHSVQEQSRSPTEGRNTFTTGNDNYSQLIANSPASLLFPQDDMSNILSQGSGQLLWDMDGQRQKLDNGFAFSNMTFFH